MAVAGGGLRAAYHRLLDRIELMLPERLRPFYNHAAGNASSPPTAAQRLPGRAASAWGWGLRGHLGARRKRRVPPGAGGKGGIGVAALSLWLWHGENCQRVGSWLRENLLLLVSPVSCDAQFECHGRVTPRFESRGAAGPPDPEPGGAMISKGAWRLQQSLLSRECTEKTGTVLQEFLFVKYALVMSSCCLLYFFSFCQIQCFYWTQLMPFMNPLL